MSNNFEMQKSFALFHGGRESYDQVDQTVVVCFESSRVDERSQQIELSIHGDCCIHSL